MAKLTDPQTAQNKTRIRPLEDRLAAQRFVVELLKANGETPVPAGLSPVQWECMVEEVGRHRLGSLAWRRLSNGIVPDVPDVVIEQLRPHYVRNAFRNAILFRETAQATRALAAESIPVMLLKGIHLARFVYEEPALRSMADIDLMVPRDRIHDAERILVGMGYGPLPRPDVDAHCAWSNHLAALEKPDAEVLEIHYDIERPTSPFKIDVGEMWSAARPATIDGETVTMLATEHLLLHLCLHLAYHHKFERSALKGLVDVATVIERAEDLDWHALARMANEWRAGPFVYATLQLVVQILDSPVPGRALEALDHTEADNAVVAIARRFILAPAIELSDSLVEIQRTRGRRKRFAMFLRGVFLPPTRMRELYGLLPGSQRVWAYYPLRVADLLRRRAGLLAHVAVRTPSVSPLFDREKDRLRIEEWAGYGDARSLGPVSQA